MQIAAIAASSNGANQIVAAPPANQKIRVYGWALSFSGSVNAKWQSGANDRTGLTYGAAGVQAVSPQLPPRGDLRATGPTPQFDGDAGAALNLNLSAGTAVGGHVLYDVVSASLG